MFDSIIYVICLFAVLYSAYSLYKNYKEKQFDNDNYRFYQSALENLERQYYYDFHIKSLSNFFKSVSINISNRNFPYKLIKYGVYTSSQLDYFIYEKVYQEAQRWIDSLSNESEIECYKKIRNDMIQYISNSSPCRECPFEDYSYNEIERRKKEIDDENERLISERSIHLKHIHDSLTGTLTVKDLKQILNNYNDDTPVCIENQEYADDGIYALNKIDLYEAEYFKIDKDMLVLETDFKTKVVDYWISAIRK